MKRCYLFTIVLVLNLTFAWSQKKDVLLTIDNQPVYVSEFKRVYQKNLDLVKDESQKSVEGYLDLFVDYKLKIAEAYDQGLHEQQTYKDEFSKYQEQLSRTYIYDSSISKDLALEAYNRSLEEIEARHILILSKYEDSPADTLVAYNKIRDIREKALNGEDFEQLAKKYSEEPGADQRGGYLGYFTAFGMVYPFESMAYNTPVGEVSEIVRTQYGYHIIHVLNKRTKGPEITVSHIMILDKPEDSTGFKPNERIREINNLLQQGEPFEKLAKQYSDDTNSAIRGGLLNKFSRGSLRSRIFESYAFGLREPGQLSKPFQSEFGWHIVKLEEIHEIPSFAEQRERLEKRVQDGDRAKVVTSAISTKIKQKYGFKTGAPYFDYFMEYLPNTVLTRQFSMDSVQPVKKELLFTVGNKDITFEDFAKYIAYKHKRVRPYPEKGALLRDLYDEFEIDELKDYFRSQLEQENEEYAATISEYRNGLLIFDLMNVNIWQVAKTDSVGLRNYYDKTSDMYQWGQRVNAEIISATTMEMAEKARKMLNENKSAEEIKDSLNTKKLVNVIIFSGKYEMDNRQIPADFVAKTGVSEIYNNGGSFVVLNVTEVIPPGPKTFDEVRGKVLNNYQSHLETEWMQKLRNKFDVDINKRVLKKVIKELKS